MGETVDLAGFPVVRNRYHDGTGCPCLASKSLDLLVGRDAEHIADVAKPALHGGARGFAVDLTVVAVG